MIKNSHTLFNSLADIEMKKYITVKESKHNFLLYKESCSKIKDPNFSKFILPIFEIKRSPASLPSPAYTFPFLRSHMYTLPLSPSLRSSSSITTATSCTPVPKSAAALSQHPARARSLSLSLTFSSPRVIVIGITQLVARAEGIYRCTYIQRRDTMHAQVRDASLSLSSS